MFKIISTSPTFGKYSKEPVELLRRNDCEIIFLSRQQNPSFNNEFLSALKDADGLILGFEKITEEILSYAPKLKIIAKHGAGVDNIDISAAQKRGIVVANAPGANRHAVADFVFGLMLSLSRKINESSLVVKNGNWINIIGNDIYGKTLGIIGTGKIGKEVIRRAKGFNMNIIAFDLYPDRTLEQLNLVKYVPFKEIIQSADFITIHTDFNNKSASMIGKNEFDLMKNEAFLINTARGGIVDEDALYEALYFNKIKGAALDVFEVEPIGKNKLLELDNFIATPHIAGYSEEALVEVGFITARNIMNVLTGLNSEYEVKV
ncbi:phosphoglycerate dehydrogenase [Neobacillus citreus]|uniref:Phosphoglycerate dehydrogenase n=1 Tax=Neobacillus citreus TaxID=2833578 RepID=A0A942T452_9BACI|nr:phosphoglycerate dehydrogenase [Neobacillus citreus]MCH6265358.1 phosphoglycerate dehydrogenase [Neobacillus citreus]